MKSPIVTVHRNVSAPPSVRTRTVWHEVDVEGMAPNDMIEIRIPDAGQDEEFDRAMNSLRSYVYRVARECGYDVSVKSSRAESKAYVYRRP